MPEKVNQAPALMLVQIQNHTDTLLYVVVSKVLAARIQVHAAVLVVVDLAEAVVVLVVIEVVDTEETIRRFMQEVDALVQEGLVTLEAVRIVRYGGQGATA